jgi:DNA (cytosine-5)-methyltransferase 1
MSKKILDLFCGGGGAGYGYHLAGFEVVGVDLEPMPKYPFEFVQDNALHFLDTADLSSFDVIHASPVCKAYTNCNLSPKHKHLKLINDVRERLEASGKPFIIENVMGAKKDLRASLMLCGSMFGLPTQRHRLFEIGNTDLFIVPPGPCRHANATISVVGHSVWDSSKVGTPRKDGKKRPDSVPLAIGRAAMGISWMGIEELAQAIPPAYTKYIGEQLMSYVEMESVA